MKFVVDAQLPPSLAAWLTRRFGVEATHVYLTHSHTATDAAVFASCSSAGTVIFTKDEDFVDLVTRLGSPPQVVWIRFGNCSNTQLREAIERALPQALSLLEAGEPVVEITAAMGQ